MPISPDFTSVYQHEWAIDFTQCMPNGQLQYTELCNILQLTAAYHAEKGGISFTDMQHADQAWVLSRMRIEIAQLPRWRDHIVVTTWIVSLENSRSVRALEVHINGNKVIGCETFWAVFNTKRRRPEPLGLPHEHFEKYNDRHPTAHRVSKIQLPEDAVVAGSRQVAISDLDIVQHVNNVKYLEWCLDLLPPKQVFSGSIHNLDMNFMKEMLLGDEAVIELSQTVPQVLVVKRNGESCFALKIS